MTKPAHTIPSLSGTFGITAKLAHNPKMPKEPSSPSRSNARTERQCIIEKIDDKIEQGQRTTRYKKHSTEILNMNDIAFNIWFSNLIGRCSEMPCVYYCHPLGAIWRKYQKLVTL